MKKEENSLYKFQSLSDFHRVFGLKMPLHPMISFIDIKDINILPNELPNSIVLNFYKIAYKMNTCGKAKYGQNHYDFGEGGFDIYFAKPAFRKPRCKCKIGLYAAYSSRFFLVLSIGEENKGVWFLLLCCQ